MYSFAKYLFLLFTLFSLAKFDDDGIIEWTDKNFDSNLFKNGQVLAMFFAPWCGHCKKLHPTWAELGKDQEVKDLLLPIVKIDCTDKGKNLCQKYGVQGYPTIKFIRREIDGSEDVKEFEGTRDLNDLKSFAFLHAKTNIDKIPFKKVDKFIKKGDLPSVIGFLSSETSPLIDHLVAAFKKLGSRFHFSYVIVKEDEDIGQYKLDSIVMFRQPELITPLEESQFTCDDTSKLTSFLEEHEFGEVPLLKVRNQLFHPFPRVEVYVNINPRRETSKFRQIRNRIIKVARENKNLTFVIGTIDEFPRIDERIGKSSSNKKDIFIVIMKTKDSKFVSRINGDIDKVTEFQVLLGKFVEDYEAGKVEEFMVSQPIPEKNDGPVKVVVGYTFNSIVMDEEKDVLLEVYAPWCGHCKKLEPIYDEVGEKFKNSKNLVIAKVDGTANDLPESYQVSGFPTIYFAKKGKKANPIKYQGSRDVEGFSKFLSQHATDPLTDVEGEL